MNAFELYGLFTVALSIGILIGAVIGYTSREDKEKS